MYNQITQLKELGFSKSRTAKQLNINRETVNRYWNMTADEFEKYHSAVNRLQILSKHEAVIVQWIQQYPTITAAQVCDWLKEHYREDFKERTVSRYVKELRDKYRLLKSDHPREYEAVEDMPMGQQLQVDFGEKLMQSIEGTREKVRFAAFVLAASRYKWAYFQRRPFTTTDLVNASHMCFQYFGGMPIELVFDQDSIVTVSENYGVIIHTYEFEKFRQDCDFNIYLCRKADPESKGKIESVVKFIKYNFLENRLFADECILNSSFLDWLDRTGNAKIHSTTKRVPAEDFDLERDYLRPLPCIALNEENNIYRTVRKDNTFIYDSNRYSVPMGTYGRHNEVRLTVKDGQLIAADEFGDDILCEHTISTGKGQLIKNTNHTRDRHTHIDALEKELNELLANQTINFLKEIRRQKSRYCRDQFTLLKSLCLQYDRGLVIDAVRYCDVNKLYSANYVKDYLKHLMIPESDILPISIPVSNKKYHITTEKRPLEVYVKAGSMK